MSKRIFAAIAALLLLAPALAFAATGQILPGRDEIALEVNKGILVKLEGPAIAVFVANPDVADVQMKTPQLIYVFGKKAGDTTVYAVGPGERVLANLPVKVSLNLTRLREAVKAVAPGVKVEVSSLEGAVLLQGTARSPSEIEAVRAMAAQLVDKPEKVINRIALDAPNQIHLRVRVAEVSRELTKKLGFNWDATPEIGNTVIGLATGNPLTTTGAALTNGLGTGLGAAFIRTNDLNLVIDALEREGLITILAEPNLTAMSGETASFLAGGEFPIPTVDDGKIAISYKAFGVALAFTPTILDASRINLYVKPEVSQLSSTGAIKINGFDVPSINTRRTETTVEVGSGQSFAIAGLLQNNTTQDLNKFPGLGDLPVLGPLFRSSQFKSNESELVIIVTPYLVRPVASKLAAPTDGFVPPTDLNRYTKGATYTPGFPPPPSAIKPGGQRLIGPSGFALD